MFKKDGRASSLGIVKVAKPQDVTLPKDDSENKDKPKAK